VRHLFLLVALLLVSTSCAPAAPKQPIPAPGKVFIKTQASQGNIRAIALAGGHPAPADMRIRVLVVISRLHNEEFNRTLSAPMDPSSQMYGHQIVPKELERFRRPKADFDEVEEWLASYGIKTLSADNAPLISSIRVEGTVAEFESALSIRIDQSANAIRFANMTEPQIPTKFQGIIIGFLGLDNLSGFAGGPSIFIQ
jgi:hypothetical protein